MGEGLRPHWYIPYCEKIVEYDDHVIECYSKSKVLENLVFLYKNSYKGDVS